MYDLIILGGGPAGLSATVYAIHKRIETLLITEDLGGKANYRMHIRGPSFVNLQVLPHLMRGGLIADAVAVISSVDPIMGEVDR